MDYGYLGYPTEERPYLYRRQLGEDLEEARRWIVCYEQLIGGIIALNTID